MRFLGWLALRFGADTVLPFILAGEAADIQSYETQPEARAAGLPADERSHGRVFRTIVATSRRSLARRALSPPHCVMAAARQVTKTACVLSQASICLVISTGWPVAVNSAPNARRRGVICSPTSPRVVGCCGRT